MTYPLKCSVSCRKRDSFREYIERKRLGMQLKLKSKLRAKMNIFHTFNIREIVKNSFRLRESLQNRNKPKELVEKQAQAKAVEAQPFQAAPRSQDKDVSTVTTYEGECVQLSFIGEENNCANQFVVYTDLKNPDCRAQCPDTIFKGFTKSKSEQSR